MAAPTKEIPREFGSAVGGFPPATVSATLYCEHESRYRLFRFKELRLIKKLPRRGGRDVRLRGMPVDAAMGGAGRAMICEHCGLEQSKPPHYSHRQWSKRRFCSKQCCGIVLKPATFVHQRPHTEETKTLLRLMNLGKPGPNRGRPVPEHVRERISRKLCGANSTLWIDGRSKDVEHQKWRNRQKAHRRRTSIGSHTQQEWEDVRTLYRHKCPSCFAAEPEIKLTEDHIVPVIQGGTNWIWNIQPLCQRCNSKKQFATIHFEVPA